MRLRALHIAIALVMLVALAGCRHDEIVVPTEYDTLPIPLDPTAEKMGLYLLNEGNMGSNKATIDFIDLRNAYYVRNMYAERNPEIIKELGDVGNDIQIYGSRLYAVINCSHKVEVMDAYTLRRIGQIDIPNCRYIRFNRGNAYVSAYVGPVAIDPDAQLGAVYRVDTATLQITAKCTVGYQPDELEIIGDYIYVANSGGYRAPNYDYTVSVVDLANMRQVEKIPVGPNLHRCRRDRYGKLWVTSRGDLASKPPRVMVLEQLNKLSREMIVTDTLDVAISDLSIAGDSLYFISSQWSNALEQNIVSYGIINVATKQLVTSQLITDGTETDIEVPYGIIVDSDTRQFYITDAKNYVSSGVVHCYDRDGKHQWSVRAGDIPAHLCFLFKTPRL